MTGGGKFSIMITIEKRYNRKRYEDADDDWSLDTIYSDGMEGGQNREDEMVQNYESKNKEILGVYEYKITIK